MRHEPSLALMVFLTFAAGCTYEDDDGRTPEDCASQAAIAVAPEVLDFGHVALGHEMRLELTVSSIGESTLFLEDVFVESPASFAVLEHDAERILEPGRHAPLQLAYLPQSEGNDQGLLHILGPDRECDIDDASVPLYGSGLAPP